MKNGSFWPKRIIMILVGLVFLGFILTTLKPMSDEPVSAVEGNEEGASDPNGSVSEIELEFPPINQMTGNPSTPVKIELGRLLFFDPVLSENNDISCATCHHPDLGFSDGLPQAIGAGGEGLGPNRSGGTSLKRNSASLWNAAFSRSFFWDGRVDSLEYQALVPLSHVDEMGVLNTDALEEELSGIEGYTDLFEAAFGGATSSITVENMVRAIASFERTLLSTSSPFDRYLAGDQAALSTSQVRGLMLFRSSATRCIECHSAPNFASETFRVIGVPDYPGLAHDRGRAGAVGDGVDGAFSVPSLRNVALSAPYMHNGIFSTLAEVIHFYSEGGGLANGVENMDPLVSGFEINEEETADLIAFLYALTDESEIPQIPSAVPSGLSPVSQLYNPARTDVIKANGAQ